MEQQQAEIEQMASYCQNLLQIQSHRMSIPQEAITRYVWRQAKEALKSIRNPEMDYPTAYAEFIDARSALHSTRVSEFNNRDAIHDFKVMQMYRYIKLYNYPMEDKWQDPASYHHSRFEDGCPGPASISHTTPPPGNFKDIRLILYYPEQCIVKGTAWWSGLYEGVKRDSDAINNWSKSLWGKGKSKRPDTPFINQLRVIQTLLGENNNYIIMDTLHNFVRRDTSPELALFQLARENKHGTVVGSFHEDLKLLDRRLPEGCDGSVMKIKILQAIEENYEIVEDETGKLVWWAYRYGLPPTVPNEVDSSSIAPLRNDAPGELA